MSSPKGLETIPFIVNTDLSKADSDTRKQIRRHVMLGKNIGKRSGKHRKSTERTSRPATTPPLLAVAVHSGEDADTISNPSPAKRLPVIYQRIGADTSFLRLADEVEPSTISVVIRFSSISKEILFPLGSCIKFEKREGPKFIELMAMDPALLHTIVLTTLTYYDVLSGRQTCSLQTPRIALHFMKALHFLREKLSLDNNAMKTSDITSSAILGLAICAYMSGEREAAEYHLSGLRAIIKLRGGVTVFWRNKTLLIELFRCDLGLALDSGSLSFIFCEPRVEPFLPYPEEELSLLLLSLGIADARSNPGNPFDDIDDNLVRAWETMKKFSVCINVAARAKQKIPEELLLSTMASLMYRLLYMKFKRNSLEECIRLGLLAYSSSIFLQWRNFQRPYHSLSATYMESLIASEVSIVSCAHLWLWLLMTGAISVFRDHDYWWLKPRLQNIIAICGLTSWEQIKNILHSIMWIDLLHENLGKKICASILVSNEVSGISA